MIRALIINPSLTAEAGHNYGATLRITAELRELGATVDCFGSVLASATVRKIARPVLPPQGLWWRKQNTYSEFLSQSREMGLQLSRALIEQDTPADLLILPCCDAVQVQALAQYLRLPSASRPPQIVLWLLFAPNPFKSMDDPSVKGQFDEYHAAFSALKVAIGDESKVAVYCEVAEMAEVYGKVIGLGVRVAPGPNFLGIAGKVRDRTNRPNAAPKIVCIGHANAAKGYRLLPETARLVLSGDANATFYIHGSLDDSNASGDAHVFEELSKLGPRVVVNTGTLGPEEYRSWLFQADLVLLPYDEEVYKTRGSGIFNEAREAGIPVVASRGCAFARPAFEGGWGVAIAERTARGIAEALLIALADLPNLSAHAEMAASKDSSESTRSILARSIAKDSSEERRSRSAAHRRFRHVDRFRLMVQQKYLSLVQKRAS